MDSRSWRSQRLGRMSHPPFSMLIRSGAAKGSGGAWEKEGTNKWARRRRRRSGTSTAEIAASLISCRKRRGAGGGNIWKESDRPTQRGRKEGKSLTQNLFKLE